MVIMRFAKTVMKNLFAKPATRLYPYAVRNPYERTRGNVGIDINSCIYCGICSKKCPTNAIKVNRGEKSWEIEKFSCIQCRACVDACPKKCLVMNKEYTKPAGRKSKEVFKGA